MKRVCLAALLACVAGAASADMSVQLRGGWNGQSIPDGQQCRLFGGNGSTPPMRVTGIPAGTVWIVAYYNDRSYAPLSSNGGHGTIAYPVSGSSADLPALPGMTANLSHGAQVVAAARSTGQYASPGYLPPCSGGRNNRYTVDLRAVSSGGQVLDQIRNFDIGRY